MYIRFVAGYEKDSLNKLNGPFTELRLLRDEGVFYDYEVERINEIFEWFNETLPCPPFSSSKWPSNAVTWFKVTAQTFISKMYDMQSILSQHDVQVRTIKETYPGKILYEDEFQVVAVNGKY